jgi:hypothetical protein
MGGKAGSICGKTGFAGRHIRKRKGIGMPDRKERKQASYEYIKAEAQL